jgi:hypothetical protein
LTGLFVLLPAPELTDEQRRSKNLFFAKPVTIGKANSQSSFQQDKEEIPDSIRPGANP